MPAALYTAKSETEPKLIPNPRASASALLKIIGWWSDSAEAFHALEFTSTELKNAGSTRVRSHMRSAVSRGLRSCMNAFTPFGACQRNRRVKSAAGMLNSACPESIHIMKFSCQFKRRLYFPSGSFFFVSPKIFIVAKRPQYLVILW